MHKVDVKASTFVVMTRGGAWGRGADRASALLAAGNPPRAVRSDVEVYWIDGVEPRAQDAAPHGGPDAYLNAQGTLCFPPCATWRELPVS